MKVGRKEALQGSLQHQWGDTANKMVAIEPILGSIKYEARSHYHSVFGGDCIHSGVPQCSVESPFIYVREIMMVTSSSSRKWGVTRFQQV